MGLLCSVSARASPSLPPSPLNDLLKRGVSGSTSSLAYLLQIESLTSTSVPFLHAAQQDHTQTWQLVRKPRSWMPSKGKLLM